MSRYIDADRLLNRCKFYHLRNGDIAVAIIDIEHAPTIKAIDEDWIVKQIQSTSGAESSYYARLLHKWREENG